MNVSMAKQEGNILSVFGFDTIEYQKTKVQVSVWRNGEQGWEVTNAGFSGVVMHPPTLKWGKNYDNYLNVMPIESQPQPPGPDGSPSLYANCHPRLLPIEPRPYKTELPNGEVAEIALVITARDGEAEICIDAIAFMLENSVSPPETA
jgi:hypothetical protein